MFIQTIVNNHRVSLIGDDNEMIHELLNVDLSNETDDEANLDLDIFDHYNCFDIPKSQTHRLRHQN